MEYIAYISQFKRGVVVVMIVW